MRQILFLLFFLTPLSNLSAFQVDILYSSSGEKSFSLVLCPINYPDKKTFFKDAQGIKEGMFTVSPLGEFKDKINILYVSLSKEEEKVYFKKADGVPPLKVRTDFLTALSREVGTYKLVIIDYINGLSCAQLSRIDRTSLIIIGRNRYRNISELCRGFLHEFGHSLGLRDECIHCAKVPAGYPNCAPDKQKAQEWWGDMVGKVKGVRYIEGCCGSWGNIRPVSVSLMNNPMQAKSFGPVNERYIREEFIRFVNRD